MPYCKSSFHVLLETTKRRVSQRKNCNKTINHHNHHHRGRRRRRLRPRHSRRHRHLHDRQRHHNHPFLFR